MNEIGNCGWVQSKVDIVYIEIFFCNGYLDYSLIKVFKFVFLMLSCLFCFDLDLVIKF